jgi:hypothetical protein
MRRIAFGKWANVASGSPARMRGERDPQRRKAAPMIGTAASCQERTRPGQPNRDMTGLAY